MSPLVFESTFAMFAFALLLVTWCQPRLMEKSFFNMRKFFRSVVAGPGRGGGAAEGFGLYIADDAVLRHHLRPGLVRL